MFSQNYNVPYLLCDKYGYLTMRNLVGLMAEVSMIHASKVEKNLDMDKLRWILYSWDVETIKPVRAGDEIEITTVAISMNKFYAYRNCYIKRDGEIVANAYAVFLLFDIEKMRPVKMSAKMRETYGTEEQVYFPREIEYGEDYTDSKEIFVRYTDLDANFHVNNAVYFDYISDLCELSEKDISYMNIVYKKEIRNKKSVIGEYGKADGVIDFRLKDKDSGVIYTYGKVFLNV